MNKEEIKAYEKLMQQRTLSTTDYNDYLKAKEKCRAFYRADNTLFMFLRKDTSYYLPNYSDDLLFGRTPGFRQNSARKADLERSSKDDEDIWSNI